MIVQTSESPAQFFLRELGDKVDIKKILKQKEIETANEIVKQERIESKKFNERDLQSVLVVYVFGDPHFKANLKTIFHETSNKGTVGQNEWIHPDALIISKTPFIKVNGCGGLPGT